MIPAQRRTSASSPDQSARPLTVTKPNGGWSSWTHIDAWPVRWMLRPLTVSAPVLNTITSPSRAYQTGATWGRPSALTVASNPGRTGASRNARHSSGFIR
jgi:hypothetical protein